MVVLSYRQRYRREVLAWRFAWFTYGVGEVDLLVEKVPVAGTESTSALRVKVVYNAKAAG